MQAPSAINSPAGYDPSFFDQLAAVEDRHFWFKARNRLIFELAKKVSRDLKPDSLVLEVGCGTGNVLRFLCKACPACKVVGLELWFEGLHHSQQRSNALLVQGDIRNFPFGKQFDLIGMFDVLEHLPEERETLLALRQALVPSGKLLVTVPAHQILWSHFDEASHHCRRYSPASIRKTLAEAGFEVQFLSQFMASLFPLIWAFRKAAGLRARQDSDSVRRLAAKEFRLIPVVNEVLAWELDLEARWLAHGHTLPIGTSLIVLARRLG
jgi:SAM-dependent methyltransferase